MGYLKYLAAALLAAVTLFRPVSAQESGWLNPDGSKPDFSQSYHNTDSIIFSWNGVNHSLSDLWLTSYDTTSNYALRIASNMNISDSGSLPWTVTVNETLIDIDARFKLHFIPTGQVYETSSDDQFSSPGFLLLQRGAIAPASGAYTAATTSSSATTGPMGSVPTTTSVALASATSTSTSTPDSSSGLTSGVKAGAAIAVTASVVVILALLLWVVRLRRRVNAASNHRSAGIIPATPPQGTAAAQLQTTPGEKRVSGLHEMLGDRRHPTELSAAKRETKVYHELAG